jgi:hypothetical protein
MREVVSLTATNLTALRSSSSSEAGVVHHVAGAS